MREFPTRSVAPRWQTPLLAALVLAVPPAHSQVVLPIADLHYDAPALPPTLWPTTAVVTRELALLPLRTLADKAHDPLGLPYRLELLAEYQDTSGDFGSVNVGNGNTNPIGYQGAVYSGHLHFSVQRDALSFGIVGSAEDLDFAGFAQQRLGVMPYGRWMMPLDARIWASVLGTVYYFDNRLESHLPPREFVDYGTVGGSVSVALHFDTQAAYRAVTVTESGPGGLSPMGSIALTYQLQSDDAEREAVYQQSIVNEADNQRSTILAGNIGLRLAERAALMLQGAYAIDLTDYAGSLVTVDDSYARLDLSLKQTLSCSWELQGGVAQTLGHEVDLTELYVSIAASF